MEDLIHKITLVLGDWSNDGHGKTELFTIDSNLNTKEVLRAYKKVSKKLGFNFIEDVCADYQECSIYKEHIKILIQNGLKLETVFLDDWALKEAREVLESDGDDDISLWTEPYIEIFLFIVKLGYPGFEYNHAKSNQHINIGGYGFFD